VKVEEGPPPPGPLTLRENVDRYFEAYVADLRSMVDVDCGTFLPDGVNQIAGMMQERFESTDWAVERRPHAPAKGEAPLGDILVARLPGRLPAREGGRRILLVGHMDTVFPEGTAAERPFRIEGSRALGPGVSDMKDGLLAGWYAVRALQDAGAASFASITYVCNPDEEIGSPFSTSTIEACSREADVCFVLEGARENGDIVSARKGVADFQITISGRAAHAGVEPERGRSATLQAARTTIALHELNGWSPGVTVNVGVVRGGTRPNVVAEQCVLEVDLRAVEADVFEAAIEEVKRVAIATSVPDTTAALTMRSGFPPMERTESTARLVEQARAIAMELGFGLRDAATGGASDANRVAALGVPVLDGLGPVGGADHSPEEWVDLDSVVPRVSLLAAMIAGDHRPDVHARP
jgi:glutamate carboxypeptidase